MNTADNQCFFIDITITDSCNFRCEYCFETEYFTNKKFKKDDILIQRIHEFLKSQWFNYKYKYLQLNFWGGEPTLNMPLVEKIFNEFKDYSNVRFFMYTNGSNSEKLIQLISPIASEMVGNIPKFLTQISYDGEPINSLKRKTITGQGSTELVLTAYSNFTKANLPITLKSTIQPSMFKYLYDAYIDFMQVTKESIDFFPTIDYHAENPSETLYKQYLQDLKDNLIKIAKIEKKRIKETGRSKFAWFNPSRAFCSAGANMTCISTDGVLYKCHGCTYEGSCTEDHKVTTLDHHNWIDSLAVSSQLHEEFLNYEPDICRQCPATFCIRCNSSKYSLSNKKEYFEKWTDYTNQNSLCSFYQLNGKIVHAIYKINQDKKGE